eukprot:scaffold22261_cov62-Phaeocystis_antarctica.AAC.4
MCSSTASAFARRWPHATRPLAARSSCLSASMESMAAVQVATVAHSIRAMCGDAHSALVAPASPSCSAGASQSLRRPLPAPSAEDPGGEGVVDGSTAATAASSASINRVTSCPPTSGISNTVAANAKTPSLPRRKSS